MVEARAGKLTCRSSPTNMMISPTSHSTVETIRDDIRSPFFRVCGFHSSVSTQCLLLYSLLQLVVHPYVEAVLYKCCHHRISFFWEEVSIPVSVSVGRPGRLVTR